MSKDLPGIKNKEVENKSALGRLIGEKQFRFSEWFAEKLIKAVSFFSIAFVILIFLFVFRETLPLFSGRSGTEKAEHATVSSDNSKELKPERYVPGEEDKAGDELRPEVYSPDAETQ